MTDVMFSSYVRLPDIYNTKSVIKNDIMMDIIFSNYVRLPDIYNTKSVIQHF